MSKPSPKTDAEKVVILAGELVFIVKGLRNGSIKSKPLVTPGTFDMCSLEEDIWAALNACGIQEKEEAK